MAKVLHWLENGILFRPVTQQEVTFVTGFCCEAKLGENWRGLGKYFHKFDAVIFVVLAVGIIWFIWSHWQNRIRTAQ